MKTSIETLISLGYKKEDAKKLVMQFPLCQLKDETLKKNIKNIYEYLSKLYLPNEIIKMTKTMPRIYTYSKQYIIDKIEFLESLGYTKEEIIKMTKTSPAIYSLSIKYIEDKIIFLQSIGYGIDEIIRITKDLPNLYSYSQENIKRKISFLESLGYTKEEVIRITKAFPTLYGLSEEYITGKVEFLISLGYSEEEVIKMTTALPTLFGLTEENIKEKIDYLNKIGLDVVITDDTKYLMQSVGLTYARYEYLTKEKDITITSENYRKLFAGEKKFQKQYNVTKKQLLDKYNYQSKSNTMKLKKSSN